MMPIVALRGYDGYGAYGAADPITPVPQVAPAFPVVIPPSSSGGPDPVIVLPQGAPPMPALTALFWIASLTAAGYIFWATLQPKSRRLVTRSY